MDLNDAQNLFSDCMSNGYVTVDKKHFKDAINLLKNNKEFAYQLIEFSGFILNEPYANEVIKTACYTAVRFINTNSALRSDANGTIPYKVHLDASIKSGRAN